MKEIISGSVNFDIIWLSVAIRNELFRELATPSLVQYAYILEFQAKELYENCSKAVLIKIL